MRETHLRMERQTVKLGLAKVVHDLFPDESLKTSYSILRVSSATWPARSCRRER